MYPLDPEEGWDEDSPPSDEEPDVDVEEDLVVERDEGEFDTRIDDEGLGQLVEDADDPSPLESLADVEQAALDDTVTGFIELFNARDWDGLAAYLSPDVVSEFFQGSTDEEVLEGINDFTLRYPSVIVTRGDLNNEPIAAAWLLDQEDDAYEMVGYFRIEVEDGEEPTMVTLEYIEEIPETADDVVIESPESTERAAWEDWSITDTGE